MIRSPREVFDDPSTYWDFLTQSSEENFESQHFDRKEAGQKGVAHSKLQGQLKSLRDKITATISAFANRNVEGGLLVLGIASNGTVTGIDHLSEEQKNSLTNFSLFLQHQAAVTKQYLCTDSYSNNKTIYLIFVPYTTDGICETPGQFPKAWIRSGSQNVPMTQEMELPRFGGEFRACVSSLFLMQFFIRHRRIVGDGRMPAMRIIPSFNVGEDSQPSLFMRTEGSAIDQFTFKGGEEAFAQRVVIAVASSPH